jgi:hypothetical protein
MRNHEGSLEYEPDFETLIRLLGVPLSLQAETQSGVPALALDVWLSYELRRAGFGRDQVWPRPVHPRILPAPVAALLECLTGAARESVSNLLESPGAVRGVTASNARILGKNYTKQVDVTISDWSTGPELLVSTKRMDSSYGKNAPNRVEESYGDAKNLRLRHPLAALGFLFGLRSDILIKEPATADWIFDLLIKLGREDDAYHATCLVLMEYGGNELIPETGEEPVDEIAVPGPVATDGDGPTSAGPSAIDDEIDRLPRVQIRHDATPPELAPSRFLAQLVTRVISTTSVNMHQEVRRRRQVARTN